MGDHGLIVGGLGLGHCQFRLDPRRPTSNFRDYGARRQALGNNRSFLLSNTVAVLGQL
jgi:hypothetical protein